MTFNEELQETFPRIENTICLEAGQRLVENLKGRITPAKLESALQEYDKWKSKNKAKMVFYFLKCDLDSAIEDPDITIAGRAHQIEEAVQGLRKLNDLLNKYHIVFIENGE